MGAHGLGVAALAKLAGVAQGRFRIGAPCLAGGGAEAIGRKIFFEHPDHHRGVAKLLGHPEMPPRVGIGMGAIGGERRRFVPDRAAGGDPQPHLPILGAAEPVIEAAKLLIGAAADGDRRGDDMLLLGQPRRRIREDPGFRLLGLRHRQKLAGFVNQHPAAKGRADRGVALEAPLKCCIKARQHEIVAVQKVHIMAPGAAKAGLEIADVADILRLADEMHPALPHLANDGLGIVQARGVIHHLDLHCFRAGRLRQHAAQRLAQIGRAMEGRDHHRPDRAMLAERDGRDGGAVGHHAQRAPARSRQALRAHSARPTDRPTPPPRRLRARQSRAIARSPSAAKLFAQSKK